VLCVEGGWMIAEDERECGEAVHCNHEVEDAARRSVNDVLWLIDAFTYPRHPRLVW
jgi:hypothetical protein